jgi:uncharacterized membrane protein
MLLGLVKQEELPGMNEALEAMIFWYPLFAVPAVVGCGLVYVFLRQHIVLTRYHYLGLILPWLIWVGLGIIDGETKSVLNLFEAVLLGALVVMLFLIEAMSSVNKIKINYFPQFSLGLSCLMAALLWAFVPGLPG